MVQAAIRKLKLFGAKIIDFNTFCVAYKINGELRLLRYINNGINIGVKEECEFDSFEINEYFIKTGVSFKLDRLYTGYSEKSLIDSDQGYFISYNETNGNSMKSLYGDSKVIIYHDTKNGGLFLINYKGCKVDISRCRELGKISRLGLLRDESGRYIVGFASSEANKALSPLYYKADLIKYTVLDTDGDLTRINYHINNNPDGQE